MPAISKEAMSRTASIRDMKAEMSRSPTGQPAKAMTSIKLGMPTDGVSGLMSPTAYMSIPTRFTDNAAAVRIIFVKLTFALSGRGERMRASGPLERVVRQVHASAPAVGQAWRRGLAERHVRSVARGQGR